MADMTAKERCDNKKRLKTERESWDNVLQSTKDMFYIESEDINEDYEDPGQELDFGKLFDSTPLLVADVLPAGFSNYMTPVHGHWLDFFHADPKINNLNEVKDWYKQAEEELWHTYDKSNFYDQNLAFYKETSIFGTANMIIEDDTEDIVRFTNMPIKQCFITDDGRKRVNGYYCEFLFTAQQAVDRFGREKVSQDIKREYDSKLFTTKRHPFFLFIGKRYNRNPNKTDNASMPIMANWYDEKEQTLVQESGYPTMPAFSHRFYDRPTTPYGYSPAMKAMMDARYLQVMGKTELVSAMQRVQPAYAFPHDAFIEPLNVNPMAANTYNSKNMSRDQFFAIGGDGNLQASEYMMGKRIENLREHMFYSVFLAFKNITKELTATEAIKIANEQMTILGPAVYRQKNVLKSNVTVVMQKLWNAGRLPDIPDVMYSETGQVPFEINFTSYLAAAQKQNDMRAMQNAIAMAEPFIGLDPTARHKINAWRGLDAVFESTNADRTILNDDKTAMEAVEAEARRQEQQEQQAIDASSASTAKDASQAAKNFTAVQA